MSSVDDLDELIATRRLNGLEDNLYREEIREYFIKPTEEQTIRILKSATHKFEIRGEELCFLKHAILNILAEREQDKKKLKEKDKQIDLMAEEINETNRGYNDYCEFKIVCDRNCKSCIKQYFERKSKE